MREIAKFFKKLYSFVLRYKPTFIVATTLFCLASLSANMFPIVLRLVTNEVSAGNYDKIFYFALLLTLAKFGESWFDSIAIWFSDKTLFRFMQDIRLAVFDHIHKLDFAYHTEKASGSLISLFKRRSNAIMGFYDSLNFFFMRNFFDITFMIFTFAGLYSKILIVVIPTIVLNLIFMAIFLKINLAKRKIFNEQDDKISEVAVDNFLAFDLVKYFANEKHESNRMRNILEDWRTAGMQYGQTFRYIDFVNGGIIILGMISTIMLAIFDLQNKLITLGDFMLATSFATIFFPKLIWIIYNFREIVKNYTDARDLLNILDEPIKIVDNPTKEATKLWKKELYDQKPAQIDFNNISFQYKEGFKVLKDINLTIKAGESIALVGRSGAGKTTFTKLLLRFYDPTQGEILIDNINIKGITKQDLRKRIGIVPQEPILFNNTIKYNIAYGKLNCTNKELELAVKKANLTSFINSLPEKYETKVGERGIKLSGGQKQRLAIARMVLADQPIIVFDEATSNLDSESEKLIQESFWKIAETKTTIIIAHRLSTVKKADRIVVIEKGKIVEEGTHAELTNKNSGIYKHLWDLQTSGELEE